MRLAHVLLSAALLPALAHADGFADLRDALSRAQAPASLKGTVKVESTNRQGSDTEEERGAASLSFEDTAQGLRLSYAPELLARLDQEERAREKDPKAPAPTVAGLRGLEAGAVRGLLAPARALLSTLADCTPTAETAEPWNGRPARHLVCQGGLGMVKARDPKLVKKAESTLDVWIAADGMPLASRLRSTLSGRALVVVSFEATTQVDSVYALAGERLVVVQQDSRFSGSGAGEKADSRVQRSVTLQR